MKRYFTLNEANALLPSLSEKLKELKRIKDELMSEVEVLHERGMAPEDLFTAKEPLSEEDQAVRIRLETLGDDITEIVDSVHDQGILVKDIDSGLLDFYSRVDGEEVFLCWKLGETDISHWHGVEEGFAQRKSLMSKEILRSVTTLH